MQQTNYHCKHDHEITARYNSGDLEFPVSKYDLCDDCFKNPIFSDSINMISAISVNEKSSESFPSQIHSLDEESITLVDTT